eukprot:378302-Rhodomonas_salina.3
MSAFLSLSRPFSLSLSLSPSLTLAFPLSHSFTLSLVFGCAIRGTDVASGVICLRLCYTACVMRYPALTWRAHTAAPGQRAPQERSYHGYNPPTVLRIRYAMSGTGTA